MRLRPLASCVILTAFLAACAPEKPKPQPPPAPAAPPIIPRHVLFGNPEKASGEVSPDGKWLGYVAPDEGVLNVFVAPREHPDQAKVVTHDRKRGVDDAAVRVHRHAGREVEVFGVAVEPEPVVVVRVATRRMRDR